MSLTLQVIILETFWKMNILISQSILNKIICMELVGFSVFSIIVQNGLADPPKSQTRFFA